MIDPATAGKTPVLSGNTNREKMVLQIARRRSRFIDRGAGMRAYMTRNEGCVYPAVESAWL